ncbi:hypothetical protein ES703_92931 [subsurface metagenome]
MAVPANWDFGATEWLLDTAQYVSPPSSIRGFVGGLVAEIDGGVAISLSAKVCDNASLGQYERVGLFTEGEGDGEVGALALEADRGGRGDVLSGIE